MILGKRVYPCLSRQAAELGTVIQRPANCCEVGLAKPKEVGRLAYRCGVKALLGQPSAGLRQVVGETGSTGLMVDGALS